jgi:recombinational DNA repair protein (RecF pathway)
MLFDLLGDVQHRLVEAGADMELLARYVEINLVTMLGYQPQLTRCAHCQAPLARPDADGRPVWPT